MPILNYTTKIPADQTIGELMGILRKHGARQIMVTYDEENNLPEAISFHLPEPVRPAAFRLPAQAVGVQRTLIKENVPAKLRSREHATNVAWRILKDWIEAQLALVEANMATLPQLLLAQGIMDDGKTLYEKIKSDRLLEGHAG